MEEQIQKIIDQVNLLVLKTPTGDLRNDLSEINIKLMAIKIHVEDGEYDTEHVPQD